MNTKDIGAELSGLIYHLFSKYAQEPSRIIPELTLRTKTVLGEHHDTNKVRAVEDIANTEWYATMRSSFTKLRSSLESEHSSALKVAADITHQLYPHGCSVSEYADAVQVVAAMQVNGISSANISRLIDKKGPLFRAKGIHVVSVEELVHDIVEDLFMESLIPQYWWNNQENTSDVRVTRVGLRRVPPRIVIEYERPPGRRRVRSIILDRLLNIHTPTAPLARRLAATHGALIPESELLALLGRLQRMMARAEAEAEVEVPVARFTTASTKGSTERGTAVSAHASDSTADSPFTAPLANQKPAKDEAGPQQADLGLLYRDPEGALKDVNLNDADDLTLREFKSVMDEGFHQNVIKPGDAGYIYDKRLDVGTPTVQSDWDD